GGRASANRTGRAPPHGGSWGRPTRGSAAGNPRGGVASNGPPAMLSQAHQAFVGASIVAVFPLSPLAIQRANTAILRAVAGKNRGSGGLWQRRYLRRRSGMRRLSRHFGPGPQAWGDAIRAPKGLLAYAPSRLRAGSRFARASAEHLTVLDDPPACAAEIAEKWKSPRVHRTDIHPCPNCYIRRLAS